MHVVWDWNGTLLDDLDVVVDAVNAALAELGAAAIDADGYRDHYTRPVRLFYEALLDRPVGPAEWRRIDETFHHVYRRRLDEARLAADAAAALDAASSSGATQSLLSMWWHDELVPFVARFGVDRYMTRVDGNRRTGGESKAPHLAAHLRAVAPAADVVVVGDALDDARAAAEAGVGCVLYDGGAHHRSELEAAGVPVAGSLLDALRLAGIG